MADVPNISLEPPPAEALSILRGAHIGQVLAQGLDLGRTRQVSVSPPIQLFRLTLSDLDGPEPVHRAKPAGWRYLISRPRAGRRGPTPFAVADLTNDANRGLELTSLHRHKAAEALAAASKIAETAVKVGHGRWEVRTLEVPAIHLTALWLMGEGDSADVFVLLHPGSGSAEQIADINSEVRRRLDTNYPHSRSSGPAEPGHTRSQ